MRRRPGATEAELDAAEVALGLAFPPAFRALYRCHDGQQLQLDTQLDAGTSAAMHESMSHGVLGGCVPVKMIGTPIGVVL